jgi:hypothetical protein
MVFQIYNPVEQFMLAAEDFNGEWFVRYDGVSLDRPEHLRGNGVFPALPKGVSVEWHCSLKNNIGKGALCGRSDDAELQNAHGDFPDESG